MLLFAVVIVVTHGNTSPVPSGTGSIARLEVAPAAVRSETLLNKRRVVPAKLITVGDVLIRLDGISFSQLPLRQFPQRSRT
jgi:hypothetical protein